MGNGSFNDINFQQLQESLDSANPFRNKKIASLSLLALIISLILGVIFISEGGMHLFILIVFVSIIPFGIYLNKKKSDTLKKFAQSHGFAFIANKSINTSQDDGIIFGIGHSQRMSHALEGQLNEDHALFYAYRYTKGHGKNRSTYNYYVFSVELNESLPYILLDNKHNNLGWLSNLPRYPSKDYEVQLEGNFHERFKMYSSVANTSDPLTLITPDVMHQLMQLKGSFDIEINNGRLTIFSTTKQQYGTALESMTSIAARVTQSLHSNVSNYTAPVTAHQRQQEDDASAIKTSKKPLAIGAALFLVVSAINIMPTILSDKNLAAKFILGFSGLISTVVPLVLIVAFVMWHKNKGR